jgi:hypothetical protein
MQEIAYIESINVMEYRTTMVITNEGLVKYSIIRRRDGATKADMLNDIGNCDLWATEHGYKAVHTWPTEWLVQ